MRRAPLSDWAAMNGHAAPCAMLVRAGADFNLKNSFGVSPFGEAEAAGHMEASGSRRAAASQACSLLHLSRTCAAQALRLCWKRARRVEMRASGEDEEVEFKI